MAEIIVDRKQMLNQVQHDPDSSIVRIPASDEYFENILPVTMLLCYHIFHSARAERLWEIQIFHGKTMLF